MKKFCFVACVALLMLVVCVPCFATSVPETTSAEPIDWFGGGGSPYYHCEVTSYNSSLSSALSGTEYPCLNGVYSYYTSSIDHDEAHTETVLFTGITGNGSNTAYMKFLVNGSWVPKMIVSAENLIEFSWDFETLPSALETPISGLTITAPGGSVGLIDSGVNAAISYLGSVLTYIWTTPSIMICIGLAVGVVLIGWGISKVKDLVVGY